ncbi:MAG TPA: hypothetical protein IAA54_03440 [Candidatus Gallacutalibacter pullicola]|uniref:Uncharacterized protein n=1 Tax=Candidatus Gallacutalibacter pullicola TaxID=2840830 RepID=A0A9D1DPK0_9FIRM|nr:hypothetical protein [Candidatus Gallacutalibacter pullicola]
MRDLLTAGPRSGCRLSLPRARSARRRRAGVRGNGR